MLSTKPTTARIENWFKYCPNCQNKLTTSPTVASCEVCGFHEYLNPAPCASIIVERNNHGQKEILIGKRGIDPFKGSWDVIGGFLSPGESFEQAARRETLEETGLTVKLTKQLGEAMPDWYGDIPTIIVTFVAEVVAGEDKANDDVTELTWLPLSQLPVKMAFTSAMTSIERYLENTKHVAS